MSENPRQLRLMLSRYFQRQIEQGHVRNLHPEALAQAFSGMFFSYAISLDIFVNGTINPDQ